MNAMARTPSHFISYAQPCPSGAGRPAVASIGRIRRGRTCRPESVTQYDYPERAAELKLRHYGLDLGVVVQDLVAHLTAPAGLLVAAERQRGVEHVVAVDPDRAGPQLLGQRVCLGDVAGPDAGPEAVLGVVRDGRDLVQVSERRRHDDRAEDLLADDLHVRPGVGQHRRLDEVAAVAMAPAACQRGRAVGPAGLQESGYALEL